MSEDFQLDYNSIKEILYDCSKTLDSSSNYIGTNDLILNYIDNLLEENNQLKEQLENNDCKTIYNQFVNYKNWYFEYVEKCEKYKSVLDEIQTILETRTVPQMVYEMPLE